VRYWLRPGAIVLSVLMVGGCALRGQSPGSRPVSARTSTTAATVESLDPALSEALTTAALHPTVENGLRVAEEYQRLGIIDAAQARVERVLDQAPRSAAAHEAMARLWRDSGFPHVALAYAHRAVYFDPANSSAYNTLGTVLDGLKRPDAARQAYLKSFALDHSAAWALSNLCSLELRGGDVDGARQYCEAAVGVSPELKVAHNNLGFVHAASGDLGRAKASFLAAGDEASANYNLGIVHLGAGRLEEASVAFEKAIQARPDFTAAKARARDTRMKLLTKKR
jgi:Flp pilus assembly protein TadD